MSTSKEEGAEGVIRRKMVFCPRLQAFYPHELIETCIKCADFFLHCCSCSARFEAEDGIPCHHFRLVFTDGACSKNGQIGATAGIGIARGLKAEAQHAIPITTLRDPNQKRTSQRAELLAALAGLRHMVEADQLNEKPKTKQKTRGEGPHPRESEKSWIIATDSEYVVKGMTEWLPTWKNNNLRTNRNTKPANLDLFLKLDMALTAEETRQDVKIGFWHVPRMYNAIADGLAKEAAQLGDPE